MLKNYLKTSLRIFLSQKAYSAINIAGLTIGLASSLLIILYIMDDLNYDRFPTNPELIYRVGRKSHSLDVDNASAWSPAPLAEALVNEVPQVASSVRFAYWRSFPLRIGNKVFTEKNLLVADSNFLEFFHFRLIQGNSKTALRGPNKIV